MAAYENQVHEAVIGSGKLSNILRLGHGTVASKIIIPQGFASASVSFRIGAKPNNDLVPLRKDDADELYSITVTAGNAYNLSPQVMQGIQILQVESASAESDVVVQIITTRLF